MRKLRTTELNRLSENQFKEATKTPIVVVLDNVRSILNVGSIFRTSDAFRFEKVYLCGLSPKPNLEMNKTALGATDSMDWEYCDHTLNLVKQLRKEGYTVVGIEQTSNSLELQEYNESPEKLAIVMGNEVNGVDISVLKSCDQVLEIPQIGTKHSLNVSVCYGIVAWEFFRKRA